MIKNRVMVSPVAGQWYSGHEGSLRREIEDLRKDMMVVRRKHICAAVVPHAAYRYSGVVAAGVYQRIDARGYDRVLVIGPSHYCGLKNKISIPDATHYKTPLGLINADLDFIKKIRKLPFVTTEPAAHVSEHSDQIQLPLIQVCLPAHLPVVCMVCGQFDSNTIIEDAAKLRALFDDKTLLVVSSDFTRQGESYGFVPAGHEVRQNIEMLDNGIFELFVRKDVEGFIKKINESGATVCGRDPLALLLAMMPENARVQQTTAHGTSGQLQEDGRNSVSYIGALVTGRWSAPVKVEQAIGDNERLSDNAGRVLLDLARSVIEKALQTGEMNPGFLAEHPKTCKAEMIARRGGFVTLKRNGHLRGCIGEIFPSREIWKVIREHACNAAFNDPRFNSLSKEELYGLEIEVSVLLKPQPVESPDRIEVGKHGVVLSKHGLNAVFLPQVASEQGWERDEMLSHLSVKAGLPPDAWKEDASFMVFEAQIFA
ncbi:MAG: AmmeMemoRadiSam system protein B [Kiritimatiellia bacterium]